MCTLRGKQGMMSPQQRLRGNVRTLCLCLSVQHHSSSHVSNSSNVGVQSKRIEFIGNKGLVQRIENVTLRVPLKFLVI